MNEKILKTLNNEESYYPHKLEQEYPHILDKIIEMWRSPEFDSHLNKLMLDKRDHYRQGFPPEVASEILRLSILHTKQFGSVASNSWVDASDVKID